jgi:hypothetical protein
MVANGNVSYSVKHILLNCLCSFVVSLSLSCLLIKDKSCRETLRAESLYPNQRQVLL